MIYPSLDRDSTRFPSLVAQIQSQTFSPQIGVDFALKVIQVDPSTVVRLQLWDIAGQERFGSMTRVYFKDAAGALVCFDVTKTQTFDAVKKWKEDLESKVSLPDGSPIPAVLVANKVRPVAVFKSVRNLPPLQCDLPKNKLFTDPSELDEFCRKNNFVGWFFASAKDNINIEAIASLLVSEVSENATYILNKQRL